MAVCLAVVGSTGVISCGADDQPSPTIREVIRAGTDAFAARDADALCDNLSRKAQLVIGHAAHGTRPLDCRSDVRNYFKWIVPHEKGRAWVTAVTKPERERAIATIDLPGESTVEMPLHREDGRWKLDGLFDATLSRIQLKSTPAEDRLMPVEVKPDRSAPSGRGGAVMDAASRSGGGPCPPVGLDRFPVLTGGCVLEVDEARFNMSLETAFGTMDFADCELDFDLVVDSRAQAWLSGLVITGPSPCLDAMPCRNRAFDIIPWPASVLREPGGRLRLEIGNVCLDTCVGRFVGSLQAGMSKERHGWRLRFAQAMVGATGWVMGGTADAVGEPVSFPKRS